MSKAKVFIKKSVTIVMAFMFMLMTNVFVARAEEKSVDGVTVSITTDEESYTVGNEENATVTVTFTNTNPYEVTVDSAALTSSYFAVEDATKIPSSITLAAGAAESYDVPMSYTFKKWVKDIEFYNFRTGQNEKLNVGLEASYAAVGGPSTEFVVDCFDASEKEHAEYLKLLDPLEDGRPVEHATIFDLRIKDSSGSTKQLSGYAKLYLQAPTGWDKKDLQTIFLSAGPDENFIERLETVDGIEYVTFITNHFSPYALVDPGVLAPATGKTPPPQTANTLSPKTGDASMKVLLPLVVSAVVFLALCLVMGKKRRSAMLALVLCAGVSFYAVGVVAEKVSTDGSGDFSIGFNDFTKRETVDSSDTAAVDAGLNVAFKVSYNGPTLEDIVYDYDYSDEYYGGPFKIKIAGGPAGWVGKLMVENPAKGEGLSLPVDFSKLQQEVDGSRWFKFDPEEGADNGDELEVGYTLKLVDNYGNECDEVVLESGSIEEANNPTTVA